MKDVEETEGAKGYGRVQEDTGGYGVGMELIRGLRHFVIAFST